MLETILVVLILFLILMWIVGQRLKRHIAEVEAQVVTEVKELFDKIIFMRTETHNDIIFAYNAVTNDFVCQGKDMEELNKNFGLRFPESKGVLIKPESEEVVPL